MRLHRIKGNVRSILPSLSVAIACFVNHISADALHAQSPTGSTEALPILPFAVNAGDDRLASRRSPIVTAIEHAEAAVVNIQGNKTISTSTAGAGTVKQEVSGMGTGVIIDPRGYIITNLHVVQDVPKIEVTLPNGDNAIAKLLNYDLETDLALIKIPSKTPLPVITFGTSHDLYRGETVIAIGNPFGYQNTVTVGVISALHRDVPVNGSQEYRDLIQTSADINPGNSGGPLLNVNGEVIGINVAVRVGAQGIGFAIPIDEAVEVMADLVEANRDQAVEHGLVFERKFEEHGVRWQVTNVNSPEVLLTSSRRNQPTSELMTKENSKSLAAVQPGDYLVSVAGRNVPPRLALELAMIGLESGDQLEVQLERNSQLVTQQLELISSKKSSVSEASEFEIAWDQLGIRVEEVDASAVKTSSESYQGGLRITEIRSGSSAAQQKLAVGDTIVGVMNWQTPSWKALHWVLTNNDLSNTPTAKIYIVRNQRPFYVPLAVSKTSHVR